MKNRLRRNRVQRGGDNVRKTETEEDVKRRRRNVNEFKMCT